MGNFAIIWSVLFLSVLEMINKKNVEKTVIMFLECIKKLFYTVELR